MRFRAQEAADALGARLIGPDVVIDGVSFDTRSLRPGQLFVPLVAERDGHEFLGAARDAGAVAALSSRPELLTDGVRTTIVVDDTLQALLALGAWGRARWAERQRHAQVVGITGSVGKTSTKDLTAAALAPGAAVWANERSFNNDQGLPSTILNAPDGTQVMVLEMGMRGFGEIARLTKVAAARIGIVTRVAEAHSELVGGIDGVARAKAELVEALPPDGWAILNGDDDRVRAMMSRTTARTITFGEGHGLDVRAHEVVLDELARPSFLVDTPWGAHPVRLAVSGRHMVGNALAAIACAGVLGHDLDAACAALGAATLTGMRMDVRHLPGGAVLIDDSYNANPTSMRAAIDALVALPAERRVAVLGVMAEIADPAREHEAIAAYAAVRGVHLVAAGTSLYGIEPAADPVAAVGLLAGGDAVLVKASRAAGLERVVAGLVAAMDDVAER